MNLLFLFALHLNDLDTFLTSKNAQGVKSISEDFENDLQIYVKLLTILCADDTVLLAESAEDLDFILLYRFKITLYILPFILHISNLYHKPLRHTVSKAFSKSINAQKSFFFFNFSSSKRPYITKVLSKTIYKFM
jgi:hypothetical protein